MAETVWVALLRGINLGGHNRVPMAALREVAASLGYEDPVTYIQSGNLVFGSEHGEQEVTTTLEGALEDRFGFPIPVIVRSAGDLAAIVAGAHPFGDSGLEPRFLVVAFLARAVGEGARAIAADEFLPDRFHVSGREVYLGYPNGTGRAKLNHSILEARLGIRATLRNWNTVNKLADLAGR